MNKEEADRREDQLRSPTAPDPEVFGSCLPSVEIQPPGPRSLDMARRLGSVESRNVTHLTDSYPVFWEEALGANVRDVDGNVYLDLTGAFGVAVVGHANPSVVEAIRGQSARLIHGMGDVHPPAMKVEFLEALTRVTPWPRTKAILGSSGSEAVEAALKTTLLATGKPGILAFDGAYHGLTLGALATTDRDIFKAPFRQRLYPGVHFAPFPDSLRNGESAASRSLEQVAHLLGDGSDHTIGTVIIEPIQGRAGVRIPPTGYLAGLAQIARDAGALLIFDEIFTGLGRTGSFLACLHEDVVPDLLCLGKGLGGGLPLSACLGPPEVMDAWPNSGGEAIHTSTFLGHPLACGSGLAVLKAVENDGLVERSSRLGSALLTRLQIALAGIPEVAEVRGRGLFLGVELTHPDSMEPLAGAAVRVAKEALQEGILVLPAGTFGHVVEISPPLVITEEQVSWVVNHLAEVVRRIL